MADTCAIEDCDRSSRVRGWCDMHYRRWKITGDPTKTIIAKRWTRSVCSVDGCDRYVAAQSYCDRHYRNWRRNGTPLPPDPPMGYKAVHQRLRAKRGPAADHLCVECFAPAQEWAYDHTDPHPLTDWVEGRSRVTYSADYDRYHPMCIRCHRGMDNAVIDLAVQQMSLAVEREETA
jgi:hypothetical protein